MPVYKRVGALHRRTFLLSRPSLLSRYGVFPSVELGSECRWVTSTGPRDGQRHESTTRWDWRQLKRRANRARAQASLTWDEWCDRGTEYRERLRAGGNLERVSREANESMRRAELRWKNKNRVFDGWFNDRWSQLEVDVRQRWRKMNAARLDAQAKNPPPLDVGAMLLLGSGSGCALQGCPGFGLFLTLWGVARASRRYVVNCVDKDDREKLFRMAPERFRKKSREIFAQLKREIQVARKLRAGDMSPVLPVDKTMHSNWDYTPESLYDDSMASIRKHSRVQEILGRHVYPVAEPDKVVYRIHEGIAEVYLGWNIAGSEGTAEVQVKSSASIVDFIYIFPQPGGRYGFQHPGFVIRPNGNWSLDCRDLPNDMKQPFGKGKDRLFRNREGVFEYDWEVKDFRHGYEDHPRRKRGSFT